MSCTNNSSLHNAVQQIEENGAYKTLLNESMWDNKDAIHYASLQLAIVRAKMEQRKMDASLLELPLKNSKVMLFRDVALFYEEYDSGPGFYNMLMKLTKEEQDILIEYLDIKPYANVFSRRDNGDSISFEKREGVSHINMPVGSLYVINMENGKRLITLISESKTHADDRKTCVFKFKELGYYENANEYLANIVTKNKDEYRKNRPVETYKLADVTITTG